MNPPGLSDVYLCKCVACRKFEKLAFANADEKLRISATQRSKGCSNTSANNDYRKQKNVLLKIGDRVTVHKLQGIIKFIGVLDEEIISSPLYVGIQLDENVDSLSSGNFNGRHYFSCLPGHGIMVPYSKVFKVKAYTKRPPTTGNAMYPSYQEIQSARKQRSHMMEDTRAAINKTYPTKTRMYTRKSDKPTQDDGKKEKKTALEIYRTKSPVLDRKERIHMHEELDKQLKEESQREIENWEEHRIKREDYILQVCPSSSLSKKYLNYDYQYVE